MNNKPQQNLAWADLSSQAELLKSTHLNDLFKTNSSRFQQLSFQFDNHLIDFSKNFLTSTTLDYFARLGEAYHVPAQIEYLFQGKLKLNSKKILGLHSALRYQGNKKIIIEGNDITADIKSELEHMNLFVNQVLEGQWRGYSNKVITDVVNIGIGGSELGPLLLTHALTSYRTRLNLHFVSTGDGIQAQEIMRKLNPETTLFLIISKTFSTPETTLNAQKLIKWFINSTGESPLQQHVIAVSANIPAMDAWGIPKQNQFRVWDFVGGRFSVWSMAGLAAALAVGFDNFNAFLRGGNTIDNHFITTDLNKNIPFILALLDVFYINYWHAQTRAILPYHRYLKTLPAYLQQLSMECLGKSINKDAQEVDYPTGNIIWGDLGSNGQHAFYQLLHQGNVFIPVDFIVPMDLPHQQVEYLHFNLANALAQAQALMQGKKSAEVYQEMLENNYSPEEISSLLPYRTYPGNRPSTMLLLDDLSPQTLGQLIAIYEHKIFIQSVIWGINPFDQWGVELGKQLTNDYLSQFQNIALTSNDFTMNYVKNHLLKKMIK